MAIATDSYVDAPFNVAVVGGGVIGLHVALGLIRRGIPVTIYEQAQELKEIGAGFGFSAPTQECMNALDPRIAEGLAKVGTLVLNGQMPWINGFIQEDVRLRPDDNLYDGELSKSLRVDFRTSHRAEFLKELIQHIPSGQVKLGKRLVTIVQRTNEEKLIMKFSDGTTAEADAVIGCDGVKSRVRQIVVGEDNPAALPHYAHEIAYRCLIDMDKATKALGKLAEHAIMYIGQGAHVGAYPVSAGPGKRLMNVAAFIYDDGEWPNKEQLTVPGSKKDLAKAFSQSGPAIRALVDALPEEQNCWAMFDTLDHPLSTFAYGRIALAGDAAHASTPHHGAGASMGVEDAIILASLLERATALLGDGKRSQSKDKTLRAVFEVYDLARRERAQWLVRSSRRQGKLVKCLDPDIGNDLQKFLADTESRLEKLYDYDWRAAVDQAIEELERQLQV